MERDALGKTVALHAARPEEGRRPRPLLSATLAGLLALLFTAPLAAEPPNLLLILDASGSMWGQIEGESKIAIARQVIDEVVSGLPGDARMGLVAYGHRREGDCQDVETVLPQGPLHPQRLRTTIEALQPKGKTPITRALEHAFTLAKEDGRPATVVLVSDGVETCGGDPCSVVGTAHSSGMSFILHVVGFGIEEQNVAALECAAEAGGGRYFDARDAAQLAHALEEAVASKPEVPSSGLRIRASADGKLADVTVHVSDPTGGQRAIGRTYTDPATNPRFLPLEPGRYTATISALAIQDARREVFDFTVAEDQIVEREVDFSSGGLSVGATHNGELGDAVIRVTNESGKQVASGRTYTKASSNPKSFRLRPGAYQVRIGSVEISDKPEATFEVEIQPGEDIELSHAFSSGTLEVEVVRGADLADAVVSVYARDEKRQVAKKRSYDKPRSNPVRFVLQPGDYEVRVKEVKGERSQRTLEVTVPEAAGTAERVDLGG